MSLRVLQSKSFRSERPGPEDWGLEFCPHDELLFVMNLETKFSGTTVLSESQL